MQKIHGNKNIISSPDITGKIKVFSHKNLKTYIIFVFLIKLHDK